MHLAMQPLSNKIQTVFVIKDYMTYDIQADEIIETETDRFKSVKFRHTFYKTGEFFFSRAEAFAYCRLKNRDNNLMDN